MWTQCSHGLPRGANTVEDLLYIVDYMTNGNTRVKRVLAGASGMGEIVLELDGLIPLTVERIERLLLFK